MSPSSVLHPFRIVFGNIQSWLAGIVGGLLFAPTTIGAMVWATSFLHNGQHLSMADAASNASMVPIGWVIGCPLLGYISDKIGLRKPVLIGGAHGNARGRSRGGLPARQWVAAILGPACARGRIRGGNDNFHHDQRSKPIPRHP
jgi:MFS family permease